MNVYDKQTECLVQQLRQGLGYSTSADVRRVERAMELCFLAHEGQQRKHGAPYVNHPLRAAVLLREEFGIVNATMTAATLLHDVLEDSPDRVSPEAIRSECGTDVLDLVEWLTSPSEAEVPDKAKRNREKAHKILAAPRTAWYIKLADRIDNLRDACLLTDSNGRAFRVRYYDESVRYYLPMAQELENPRVLSTFQQALLLVQQVL